MNRTFKVAKSLTRGVVVTSEKASSYQGKAVKTVVAAAVAALVAGTAVAAETAADETPTPTYGWTTQEGITNATISTEVKIADGNQTVSSGDALTIVDGAKVVLTSGQYIGVEGSNAETAKGVISVAGGEVSLDNSGLHANDFTQSGGTITVGNKSAANVWAHHANVGGYYTYTMTGGTMNVNEGGRLWIGIGDGDTIATMKFQGGTLNLKGTETNYAIVSTMTFGTFSTADGKEYYQPLSFEGTNVNVDGSALLMSRDIQIGGGVIKVNDDAHLYLLAEKQLGEDDKVLTSATSNTWSKGSVTVTGGEITVAEKGTLSVAHDDLVLKGGTISNAGTLEVKNLTIQGGKVANTGTLKADVLNVNSQIDSTAKGIESTIGTINLNKGGTLNLTALNGNFAKGLGDEAPSDSDTTTIDNFVFVGGTMNINGGAITVNGTTLKNMKVGTESGTAKVVVNSDFALDKIVLGAKGEVDVRDKFTVGNLYIFNGNSKITNNGTVVIGEVTLTDGALGTTVFDNTKGTIYTKVGNVATLTNGTAATTTFGGLVKDEGKIYDNVTTGTMKLDDMTAYKTAIGNLTFLKVTATDDKGNAPTFDAAATAGLTSPATTVTAASKDGVATLNTTNDVVLANVEADAKTKTVEVSGSKTLTLAGSGTLFGDKVEAVNVKGATLVFGHEEFADAEGTVTGAVKLTDQGKFNVVAGSYKVGGLVTTDANTTVNVNSGALATAYLTAGAQNVTVTDGILAIKGNEPQVVAPADANDSFKNAVSIEGVKFEQVQQDSTNTGVIAAGTDDLKAVAAAVESVYGDELDGKNIVYVTKQTKFTNEPTNATDYLIDVAQVAATDGYKPADGVISGTVAGGNDVTVTLQNVKAGALDGKAGEKTLKVATSVTTATKVNYQNWFYGDAIVDGGYNTERAGALGTDGTLTFQANASALAKTNGMVIGKLVEKLVDEVATETNEVVNELATGTVGYHAAVEEQAAKLVDAGSLKSEEEQNYIDNAMDLYFSQIEAATEMALASGVFGTSLDINDQVTGAVERRTSLANLNAPRTVGFTPWVDVFGTKNEAKRIYDGTSGYEADIYGAVLGFDYTASCGGTLGVAFNVGQADANSTNISEAKIENDADFYGFSLYAAQTFGDFNVRADFGYTQVKNDLSMAGVTKTWKESQDADMITFGVGTEYLVQAGALNVVPHAGIRMTRIDLDDSKFGGEYEAMTVYQLPLGVTFSGTFEQAGWKVAPMVDLTVVPTFGDKDAEVKFYGGASDVVRAVDSNPIRATLGVEAQTGAWTFGVNYGLTAGSDDRLNNSFNANARYTF